MLFLLLKKIDFFYFFKLIFFFNIFISFDILMIKIIFKNKKYIILIHFWMKNTLKNNRNHTPEYALTK